jgi:hypothetical protein
VDDVKAQMPAWMLTDKEQPVTDALAETLLAVVLAYQHRSAYAAAQADIQRSTEEYLDGLGQDRTYERGETEDNPDYRARILDFPDLVAGWAIRAVVNALLAPFTATTCHVFEPTLDRLFIGPPSGADWNSFIGRNPEYPTRFYEQDAADNGGYFIAGNEPGAARCYDDHAGRLFHVRIPDLAGLHDDPASVYSSVSLGNPDPRQSGTIAMHIGDGSNSNVAAYLTASSAEAQSVYQAIINAVDQIKGHTVRWILEVDPSM